MTANGRGEALAKLDAHGIDEFCANVIDGMSYRGIARKLGINASAIVDWLAVDSERSARAAAARVLAAHGFDEMAEEILLTGKNPHDPNAPILDSNTRREVASHYRWRARVVNPRVYGEKLQIDQTVSTRQLSEEEILRRRAEIVGRLEADGIKVPEAPRGIEPPPVEGQS